MVKQFRRSQIAVIALAVVASLLTLGSPVAAQQPTLQLLPPNDGEIDVNFNDRVRIQGSDLPDGPIEAGRLVGVRANGQTVDQALSGRNAQPSDTASYIRNDGGTVEGRQRLGNNYANPREDWCLPDTGAQPPPQRIVETYVELTIDGQVFTSTSRNVDHCQPRLVRYDVTGPDTIVAVFSEPVRYAEQGLFNDSGLDWTVEGPDRVVVDVEPGTNDCADAFEHPNRDGCTRILTLGRDMGEDATPTVRYRPENRPQYVDGSNGSLQPSSFDFKEARDRIIPRKPGVVSIDGVAPTADDGVPTGQRVASREPAPEIELDSVTEGHAVEVRRGSSLLTTTTVTSDPHTFTLSEPLGPDGTYDLQFVAVDTANPPNRSTDEGSPAGENGTPNPVSYVLDTRGPRAIGAARVQDPAQVLVTFQRPPYLPDGAEEPTQVDAGTWTVDGQDHASVERTEVPLQLLITFPSAIPQAESTSLTWTPDPDAYTDFVGNEMAPIPAGRLLITPPPPVAVPTFTIPTASTPRFVNTNPFTVAGTVGNNDAEDINDVEVRIQGQQQTRSAARDGNTWSLDVDLPEDGAYRFQARNRSIFGGLSNFVTSTEVVLDTTAPIANLLTPEAPEDGGILGGGSNGTETGSGPNQIRFHISNPDGNPEPNFDSATVTATFDDDPDIGDVVIPYTAANPGTADQPVSVPLDIPEGYIGTVTVTLQATDLAGNTSNLAEGVFDVIDAISGVGALNPNAGGVNATAIKVDFGDAVVTGEVMPGDFGATNGIDGGSHQGNTGGSVQDGDAVATFSQPFPGGGLFGSAVDNNATPQLTHSPGLFSDGLQGEGGETVIIQPDVRDVIPPGSPTVSSTIGSPARLDGDAPEGTDCSQVPAPQGCPFTASFTGSTTASARPNRVTVSRDAGGQPGQVLLTPEQVQVAADGTFSFRLPVTPNDTTRFVVEVEDPAGNPAPEFAIAEITEDSLGPDVERLVAALDGEDEVQISFRLVDAATDIQSGNTATLGYRAGGGDFQTIAEDLPVDADGDGSFTWDIPEDVDLATTGLQFSAVGTDQLGNVGEQRVVPLGNIPTLTGATAINATTVRVTTSEPVTTETPDASGFTIAGGPGVTSATVDGDDRIVLELNSELPTGTDLRLTYNGAGGWEAEDGRPLQSGSVPLRFEVVFGVTGLAAGPNGDGGVVLSFVDERNPVDIVTGYEVTRDGDVIATLDPADRILTDDNVAHGEHTYTVTTLATGGRRSDPASVTIVLGDSPVPPGSGQDGGTGFPTASTVVDECVFPAEPNIDADGGVVVSCDGRVAALVPAGIADGPMYATFVQRTMPATTGYSSLTDLYQLVAVQAPGSFSQDGLETVEAFTGYAEISFRDLADTLAQTTPELTTALRLADDLADEQAPRVGRESLAVQAITLGTFRTVEAQGRSLRVYGPDPAVAADRFATAAALSQTQFRRAGGAVLARADDYPDALAAAPLATLVGGPVLLTNTDEVPITTIYELRRLGVTDVTLVGGTAAISGEVEDQLFDLGFDLRRIAGPTRFETAAAVADVVGSVDGEAFLVTGTDFADALAASAPAAQLGRPILLTATDTLVEATATHLATTTLDGLRIVGGPAAVSEDVAAAVTALGIDVARSGGATRYDTSRVLADDLGTQGLLSGRRPILASGDGDGRTSPDALAGGPIAGRLGTPLLLTQPSTLSTPIAQYLSATAELRGVLMAGGPAAVSDDVRQQVDAG